MAKASAAIHALPDGFADKLTLLAQRLDDLADRAATSMTKREYYEQRHIAECMRLLARFPKI